MRKYLSLTILLVVLGSGAVFAAARWAHRSETSSASVFYLDNHQIQSVALTSDGDDYPKAKPLPASAPDTSADVVFDLTSSTVLLGRGQQGDSPSIWTLNRENGEIRKIYNGASMARLSPDSGRIVVTNGSNNEIHLLTLDGVDLARIGVHGGSAAFSPDGNYLAYMKLSDESENLEPGNPRKFVGIAVYDINSGEENLVLPARNHEYGVASWSPDGSRIYYLAEKEIDSGSWSPAMYSMKSNGSDVRIEIDPAKSSAPPLNSRTVWFPEERIAVSEGDGVWCYLFDRDFHIIRSTRIAEGNSLQAFLPGASFTFRVAGNKSEWVVLKARTIQGILMSGGKIDLTAIAGN